jgi:hypothetical protein
MRYRTHPVSEHELIDPNPVCTAFQNTAESEGDFLKKLRATGLSTGETLGHIDFSTLGVHRGYRVYVLEFTEDSRIDNFFYRLEKWPPDYGTFLIQWEQSRPALRGKCGEANFWTCTDPVDFLETLRYRLNHYALFIQKIEAFSWPKYLPKPVQTDLSF